MFRNPSERTILFLVASVQFVNVLDFMMVMPMGPDFAKALHIPTSHIGYIGGSYTAAAAISGMLCALFLDRFDRRSALAVAMLGLVLGTLAGGFAVDLQTLVAARVLAGIFGGPAHSLALAIVADIVPPERRGKAIGMVLSAFSVASILGVPAGLELARVGGWRMPFFAVSGLGLLIAAGAIFLLPPLRFHLTEQARREQAAVTGPFFSRPAVLLGLAATASLMMAAFVVAPNLSAYLQYNRHYPREHLGLLYLFGGACSFVANFLAGRMVDRWGSPWVGTIGTVSLIAVLYWGMLIPQTGMPVLLFFILFMVTGAIRGVAFNTLTTRVPFAGERARFLASQSAVQHLAAAGGAFLSSELLQERADKSLDGMPFVVSISIGMAALLPLLLWLLSERLRRRTIPSSPEPALATVPME